jgi:hypothetical protein
MNSQEEINKPGRNEQVRKGGLPRFMRILEAAGASPLPDLFYYPELFYS